MKTALKILMLEDSDADAEMVQRMAKKSDYNCQFKVMMTKDVYEKALVEFKPDIILSDNAMPQFSASEALQILQQHDLHIPFILVTGTVSEEFAASIIKAGADDYLLKDRLTRLPQAIEAALKQKQTEKEKREAAQGLQQSEEKYRRMAERVTDGFVALDNNWNYTYVNKQAGEILKRAPEELVGKNIWTEFPEGVDKPFYKGYHKALDEQRYIHFEEYYPPFDFWLENHIYPSHDGVSVYFRDVTEKKKAEALLKEERDKFAKIASSSPGLICSFKLNTDGMISMPYASAALENILGFKYDLVQYDVSLLFEHTHPEDLEYFKKTIAESAQNLNHWSHEFRYLHPIKGLLWIGGNMLPSREADDCIIWHGIMNDVTERKNNERALDEERDKFAKIATTSPGLIYSMRQNKEGVLSYPYASDAIKEIYGFVFEEIENAPHKIFELIHPDDIELVMKSLYHTKTYLVSLKAEYRYYHPAKGLVWHEVNSLPVEESGGDVVCHGIIMDITERKSAEQKVIKANRLYFFISQINQMIVRTTDEITLFNEVCRIAVELGKFRMAWIGMIDEQTKKIIPVMHAGEESGYLSITKSVFSIDDNPEGHGPTGTSAREGRYIVCNDIENDDRMMPWKEDALARGYHSSMSLPVKKLGKIVGSFSVYASEKFFFDAEEIALLEEATSDLSFALENFEKENQRQKAEAAVIKSEQRYHTLTDVSPVGIFHTDATGDTTYVNPRWCEISGLSFKEGIGYGWLDAVHEDDKRELIKGWENATEVQEFSSSEYRFVRNDGTIAWVLGQATPERNAANEVVGYVGTITDITERKKAEEEIKMVNQRFEIIAAATNDAVFEVDLITGKSSHNKAFIELLDFGIGAVNTDNRSIWRSKLHPDDSERVIKKLEKTYAGTATTWSDEFRFKKADGSYGIFYDRASIIRDDSGKAIRFLGSMVEITDLKKAEEEIKKSNERFELIAKATNDGLWDWNLETNKVWGNEVHQQLYGLTLADPVPSYDEWKKRIHPEDRERTVKALEDAKASGQQSYIDEYRFYAENAGWMNIYGRTLIERNKDGKAIRLIGSMMDITERKKAEELLLANEKRFRKLLENGNDAFAILDISGKPFYVSSSVKRVLGYTEEEISKMDMFTLVHPDNIEEVQKTMQIVMQNPGVPVTSHLSRLLHKDGTYHWFEDTITNLIDDPDIGGIVDNFRDVTERVKDQLALQDSEEKYRDIVENITDILCTHDLEGNTLSVNATAKKALGYKVEDMLKMKIQDILLPYSKERFADYISTLKKNGFAQGLMYVQTSTGENRIWEFRNTLRTIEGKAPFVYGFAQDVTERIAAEEKLKSKNAQLQTLSDNLPGVMIYQLVGKRDGVKKFTYVSNGVAAITGKTPEEVIENPDILYDVIYKEDIAILIAAEHESLLKMTVLNVEVRCLTYKDEIRWLNIISTPRKLESGQIVWDGFHIDITERKKAEDILRESEETFSKIFYLNPSVCAINDLKDDKFVNVNEAFINYFGFSKEEVIGKTSVELGIMIPDIRNNILNKMDEHGIIHNIEASVKTRSGESKDVLLSTSNIYLHKKEYAYTVSNDITERKKAEETIKKANERFELFAKATNDIIWDWNLLTGELWWNENYYNLFDFKEGSINKNISTWSKHIHPDDKQRIMDGLHHAIESGEKYWDDEYRFVKDDKNPMFIYDRGFVLRDETGKPYRMIGSMLDFTERKKAEEARKASEEQYRILVEQASDGIFIADSAGKFVIVNTSGCKLSGYTAEELKGLTIYDLVSPDSLVINPFKFEEMHQPQGGRSERKLLCKDGTEMDVEISAKFLSDSRFIAFVRDISERIKAEEAIRASEEKYRSLVEQASDAIFIADTSGRFVTVNPSACKLSQYSEEELMQMNIYDFTIEEDITKRAFRFEELKQGKTTVTERVMKGKNGIVINVEITSKLLSDGRLLAFVRDISERIKAQNEIIKEKNLSDSIINSLPASFFMISIYGKILRWNRHLEMASKYSAEEISVMKPLDFFDDADKEMLSQKIANVFLAGEDSVEATVSLKTGEKLPYYFKGIAIEYDGEPCIMGVGIDISERVKAQEEIKQTSEKLRQLTAHLQRVREDERKRIGREIHDELGQQLTAIKMDVAWIDKKTPDETTVIKNKLKNIITLLDGSNQSIRRILSELRPGILDDNGLLEALEWLNRQFTTQTGVAVEFETTETELKLPEPVATCIYRIYQEAFTNITRYAHASKVATSLDIINDEILVTIEDDGKGFDVVAAQSKISFGILGMKERILSLNGIFQLISVIGKGTKIAIALPLTV